MKPLLRMRLLVPLGNRITLDPSLYFCSILAPGCSTSLTNTGLPSFLFPTGTGCRAGSPRASPRAERTAGAGRACAAAAAAGLCATMRMGCAGSVDAEGEARGVNNEDAEEEEDGGCGCGGEGEEMAGLWVLPEA